MRNLSISVLKNFPFGNPNRGKDGEPKTCVFGGVRRARISSQCQNRVMREAMRSDDKFQKVMSVRTRQLPARIAEAALKFPNISEQSGVIATKIVQLFRSDETGSGNTQMLMFAPEDVGTITAEISRFKKEDPENFRVWLDPQTLLVEMFSDSLSALGMPEKDVKAISPKVNSLVAETTSLVGTKRKCPVVDPNNPDDDGIQFLAKTVYDLFNSEDEEESDRLNKVLAKKGKVKPLDAKTRDNVNKVFWDRVEKAHGKLRCHKIDTGLWGRMITNDAFVDVEGAMSTAHAISVNEYVETVDYFTCVDDVVSRGAGHLGEKTMHSSMFYCHYNINLDVLEENVPLMKNPDAMGSVLENILRTVFNMTPSGLSLKTDTHCPAEAMLIEFNSTTQLPNQVNAYLNAIRGGEDYLDTAVERLGKHVGNYDPEFPGTKRVWLCHSGLHLVRSGKPIPNTGNAESVKEACEIVRSFLGK